MAAAFVPQQQPASAQPPAQQQQQRPQGGQPPQSQQVIQPPPGVANAPIVHLDTVMPEEAGTAVGPKFFTATQFATLKKLCAILMPAGANGAPGAVDAQVPEFLDFLLSQSPADRQQMYRAGLDGLKGLDDSNAAKMLAPLKQTWTYDPPKDPVAKFLRQAKLDVRQATLNSREWAKSPASGGGGRRAATGAGLYWNTLD
ncbi:hypothetical protein F183_A01970 [Bryobacterales bacterium F-183]|nr:hypothetical protein F183_A01970 [Bryobacterales bacterium F-183]